MVVREEPKHKDIYKVRPLAHHARFQGFPWTLPPKNFSMEKDALD